MSEFINSSPWFPLFLAAIIIVALVAVVTAIKLKWRDYAKNRQTRRRLERGVQLESEGRKVLEKMGFEVIDYQREMKHIFQVDSRVVEASLRLDYMVERNGKTYIVEVKTGEAAKSGCKDTRRQMLEYDYAGNYDGIYLLDMEKEELHEYKFESKKCVKRNYTQLIVMAVSVVGMVGIFWPTDDVRWIAAGLLALVAIVAYSKY